MKLKTPPVKSRTIIVSSADEEALNAIADAYPLASSHRVAQAVYRCGLRTIRQDPARLVQEERSASEGGATR
jgi:hypothetical protein